MEEGKRRTSKVSAWGIRLQVPSECLRFLNLSVGDEVEWIFREKGDKKEVILRKAEGVSDSND